MLLKSSLSVLLPAMIAATVSFLLVSFSSLNCPHWPASLLFFLILQSVLAAIYNRRSNKPDFTQLLLVTIVLKLLLSLIFIVCYAVVNRPALLDFATHFILHFVIFTVFEISYILRLIRK